eukprot:GHVQ01025875.1.p1 GENE.GHVQ01025875.1~~GHVQ01025875.1.p1  ORF type:complete len:104 (+),score=18.30 GHVQ01025875.1:407-718(+)
MRAVFHSLSLSGTHSHTRLPPSSEPTQLHHRPYLPRPPSTAYKEPTHTTSPTHSTNCTHQHTLKQTHLTQHVTTTHVSVTTEKTLYEKTKRVKLGNRLSVGQR